MAATKDAVDPTEERDAGAVSHEEEHWYGTDWYQANRNVRRLQVRIVKATKEGGWGKQHLCYQEFTPARSLQFLEYLFTRPSQQTAGSEVGPGPLHDRSGKFRDEVGAGDHQPYLCRCFLLLRVLDRFRAVS
jgi:reverse transcriptase-like protein